MGWSNIFLQLTTTSGPILGESQLDMPFMTQIELLEFSWDMSVHRNAIASGAGGMMPDPMAAASSFLGVGGKEIQVHLGQLEFKKRFDIASSGILSALDNGDKVLVASISVLNVQKLGPIRDPGFNLTVTNGYFTDVKVDLQTTSSGADVIETAHLSFTGITMTYMRKIDAINAHVPTNPFMFNK